VAAEAVFAAELYKDRAEINRKAQGVLAPDHNPPEQQRDSARETVRVNIFETARSIIY